MIKMSYQALYRVWRPQKFEDLVGQELITKTIKNALITKQTSHAYLFSGPRGTGKTSLAKIFAKAINCHHLVDGEPCNQCETCELITAGRLNDVIEIDAASNNGVDEIREIRDKVNYAPTQADYKVYIIDEVHMLSNEAFNALLKTLEEPPANVIFILATTEPHSIPATIISRTQRFDFKRITPEIIYQRMVYILNEKAVPFEDEALKVIAKAAAGGMRDALSILDQVISFGEANVTLANALLVTGSITRDELGEYLNLILQHDSLNALLLVQKVMQAGKDPKRFIEDLISYARDLLLYKQAPEIIATSSLGMIDDQFKTLAGQVEFERLYQMIILLNEQLEQMRFASQNLIYLEVLTVKLAKWSGNTADSSSQGVVNEVNADQTFALQQQVQVLQQEVQNLKKLIAQVPNHPAPSQPVVTKAESKVATASIKSAVKAPMMRGDRATIFSVLDQATKADRDLMMQAWDEAHGLLAVRDGAYLALTKVVAASPNAVVITFEHEAMCVRAQNNANLLAHLNQQLQMITGRSWELIFISTETWQEMRQAYVKSHKKPKPRSTVLRSQGNEPQPTPPSPLQTEIVASASENEDNKLVAAAINLFGADLVEVTED